MNYSVNARGGGGGSCYVGKTGNSLKTAMLLDSNQLKAIDDIAVTTCVGMENIASFSPNLIKS